MRSMAWMLGAAVVLAGATINADEPQQQTPGTPSWLPIFKFQHDDSPCKATWPIQVAWKAISGKAGTSCFCEECPAHCQTQTVAQCQACPGDAAQQSASAKCAAAPCATSACATKQCASTQCEATQCVTKQCATTQCVTKQCPATQCPATQCPATQYAATQCPATQCPATPCANAIADDTATACDEKQRGAKQCTITFAIKLGNNNPSSDCECTDCQCATGQQEDCACQDCKCSQPQVATIKAKCGCPGGECPAPETTVAQSAFHPLPLEWLLPFANHQSPAPVVSRCMEGVAECDRQCGPCPLGTRLPNFGDLFQVDTPIDFDIECSDKQTAQPHYLIVGHPQQQAGEVCPTCPSCETCPQGVFATGPCPPPGAGPHPVMTVIEPVYSNSDCNRPGHCPCGGDVKLAKLQRKLKKIKQESQIRDLVSQLREESHQREQALAQQLAQAQARVAAQEAAFSAHLASQQRYQALVTELVATAKTATPVTNQGTVDRLTEENIRLRQAVTRLEQVIARKPTAVNSIVR